jgi:hypothetical protein
MRRRRRYPFEIFSSKLPSISEGENSSLDISGADALTDEAFFEPMLVLPLKQQAVRRRSSG